MAETLEGVVEKLQRHPQYPAQFKTIFGNSEITSAKMLKMLSQFMNVCVSANSKYDKFVRNEGVTLTAEEQNGLQLFKTKCGECHKTDLFTDFSFRNNGLEATQDAGRYKASLIESDKNKFRVPSLRNLAYTAPYMHDGRFHTLEEVLNHYASQVRDAPTLDPFFKQNGSLGIPLTVVEKQHIITFLKTLDDTQFIKDQRFSEQ